MQKSFDKSSLENQNLVSLSNRIAQISRVNADFLSPFPLWCLKPIHRLWTAYQSLWRCVVAATPTPDYTQERAPPPIWAFLKSRTYRSISNAILHFSPNPNHSKSSPNGNHPLRAGKPHYERAVLRRRIYRQYGRNHRHHLRQHGRPFRPQHPHKCERKHGTPCHSHSNPSPPCGKLGIFRFVIRACGIHSN